MSDDALARHIDERMVLGDAATPPSDAEIRDLAGTVALAHAALMSPSPDADAERQSREQVVSRLKNSAEAEPRKPLGMRARIIRLFRKHE